MIEKKGKIDVQKRKAVRRNLFNLTVNQDELSSQMTQLENQCQAKLDSFTVVSIISHGEKTNSVQVNRQEGER